MGQVLTIFWLTVRLERIVYVVPWHPGGKNWCDWKAAVNDDPYKVKRWVSLISKSESCGKLCVRPPISAMKKDACHLVKRVWTETKKESNGFIWLKYLNKLEAIMNEVLTTWNLSVNRVGCKVCNASKTSQLISNAVGMLGGW